MIRKPANSALNQTALCTADNRRRIRCIRSTRNNRKGLSLLEVVLGMAIMGAAMAIIGNMVGVSTRSAGETRWQSQAQILCDTVMAEVTAGALPLEGVNQSVFPDRPEWMHTIQIQDSELTGLLQVDVIVQPTEDQSLLDPYQLTRLMPDPDYEPEQGLVQ